LHIVQCGSAVQLSQGRGDEREIAGGDRDSRVRFRLTALMVVVGGWEVATQ
jgi:hypothetical protein